MGGSTLPITIWNLNDALVQHQYSPKLAECLCDVLNINHAVYDFGCGKGDYIQHLYSKGYSCFGYEGTKGIERIKTFVGDIINQDLTDPFSVDTLGSVLCLEVAEHILPEKEKQFLDNITSAVLDKLIISWAVKGQGGHGHNNEQDRDYVIPKLESYGFIFDENESEKLRKAGGSELWWFNNSIYVFNKI